ncbi:hypothetical protein BYT27DRAFT_7191033 [Phlegmacium glaucopus]|nr:hypothetical protein BYT27DRAFT_7191033 [Phlegmacium glaucopus]
MGGKNKKSKQPVSTAHRSPGSNTTDSSRSAQDPQSLLSPLETPPTSPSSPSMNPHDQLPQTFSISADDVISKDIVAIADVFATMKKTMLLMTNAFDRLGIQTETFTSLSLDIKAAEQLNQVRKALDDQIARQKYEIEALADTLKTKIKEVVKEKMKSQLHDIVKASIREKVAEKVRNELSTQIPGDLHQQIVEHRRQILEIKTNLHNSEARRYNASLQSSSTARLRPLLRPLPTPEQSPTIIVIEHSTLNSPVSAMPNIKAPAPSPIKRSISNSFLETPTPTPSDLFPRDLKALFNLGFDEARTLLQQYGLVSGAPSPVTPKPRGLASVNENESTSGSSAANAETNDPTACHVEDMNKFMAHIGVPFLMIPPPISKEPQSPTMSPTSRRRMLAPLIINATPKIFY